MPLQTDFFKRPSFVTPQERKIRDRRPQASSSPLSEPPPSSLVDLTSEPTKEKTPEAQDIDVQDIDVQDIDVTESAAPSPPPEQKSPSPTPKQQSFDSFLSTNGAAPSSLNESLPNSQRIIKGGKEVVISSDGEDGFSDSSFDGGGPALQYAHLRKPREPVVPAPKPAKKAAPKKFKFSLDTLLSQALEDKKADAEIAQLKAKRNNPLSQPGKRSDKKNGLHEDMLTSALGDKGDDDGRGAKRVIDAVRRTEALDQDKTWHFLDQTRTVSTVPPEFPKHLFPPSSNLGFLREPEPRERAFQSGILEFALSRGSLSDEFIVWLFRSIPLEPREELRQAYQRVIMETKPEHLATLIHPTDIDDLFLQIGAKPQALDLSRPIEEDVPDYTYRDSSLKHREILLCIFGLLRQLASLATTDILERAIQILLRITLDTALMGDDAVRSELQSCLTALLENVPEGDVAKMEQNICTTVYDTFKDVDFQCRMIQHILPTSTWISSLRCRLAAAFLLGSRSPLTEPVEKVLDMKRITVLLMRDERFQVKSLRQRSDRDFGELFAVSVFLDVVINSSLIDLQELNRETAIEFNSTVDKLCMQIKRIFSSIDSAGASHMKRMLAKEGLELVHYRVVYAVRTKPPPIRRTKPDGNLDKFVQMARENTEALKKKTPATEKESVATEGETATAEKGDTSMPLRPQLSSSQRST